MTEHRHCPSDSTVPSLAAYETLADWTASDVGTAANATALRRAPTVEEQALSDAHEAVLRRALTDEQTGHGQQGEPR